MKIGYKPELYKKTVDILFQAYFNNTLVHANCFACAVGNIVAANCGYEYERRSSAKKYWNGEWELNWKGMIGYDGLFDDEGLLGLDNWYPVIKAGQRQGILSAKQIESTGYTFGQLRLIEDRFEHADFGNSGEDYMFNGLTAVLEALKEIHQVTDDEETLPRFQKHYATLK